MEFTTKRRPTEPRDFKERFEFRFTTGGNIICQRYFKIPGFNEISRYSEELTDAIRGCAALIQNDLRDKTSIYLACTAPRYFASTEEMTSYFEDDAHKAEMRIGEGIVVGKKNPICYAWGKNDAPIRVENFDGLDLVQDITDDDLQEYKFAFYDNGREVCSVIWTGCYPRSVRNSIDLSNKRGKCDDPEELQKLSFDRYVLYKMVEGRPDLNYKLIKDICYVCGQDNTYYTTTLEAISNKTGKELYSYDNLVNYRLIKEEVKRIER